MSDPTRDGEWTPERLQAIAAGLEMYRAEWMLPAEPPMQDIRDCATAWQADREALEKALEVIKDQQQRIDTGVCSWDDHLPSVLSGWLATFRGSRDEAAAP